VGSSTMWIAVVKPHGLDSKLDESYIYIDQGMRNDCPCLEYFLIHRL
jgi:hypothetical protein